MLEVDSLQKTYDNTETPALQGVSFHLEPGKVLGVYGKSGSGKSTLLNIIAGLLSPDGGSIKVDGQLIADPDEKLVPGEEEIKLIFQDFRLKPKMTVFENINYMLLSYEDDYRIHRCEEVLNLCKLLEVRNHYVDQLSGGQKQRVAIARALANEPRLLLMDEPFSNLDLVLKDELRAVIRSIVSSHECAIIFVSHDPNEILMLSDQLLVLENGRILQMGPPREVYKQPNSLKVASMFGKLIAKRKGRHTLFYRPEQFQPCSDETHELEGKVVESKFSGAYQELKVSTQSKQIPELIYLDYSDQFEIGDKIYLTLRNQEPVYRQSSKESSVR